jgi:hypothetical protein
VFIDETWTKTNMTRLRGRHRNGLRDGAAVKGAPLAGCDRLQRLRMSRATEELASRGRPALRQEDPRELAITAECGDLAQPNLCDNRRDEKSLAGVADSRLEQRLERQAAEPLCNAIQAETAPGTVAESQPVAGIDRILAKRASV